MAYFHCLIGGGSSGGGYELTVTCNAAFAGTTITCTDGVTTLTKTCPSTSPYEVEFDIPNGGDWTISGVVSGQTITTGVSIPTTAELIAYVQKTITIYSAKEDTITYTDVYGDTQTEVFASGQTSKQITVDIDVSGSSITFTSGVAKDPSNLSNAYSKTVTIDSNTTEVYIMPDNTLYWWGYMSNECESMISGNGWNRSGYTFSAPTYSTNSFDCNASTQTTITGIATKSKVTVSKVHAVAKGTTAVNSAYGNIVAQPSKTTSSSNDGQVNIDSSSIKAYELVPNVLNDYMTLMTVNLRRFTGYAFWYE